MKSLLASKTLWVNVLSLAALVLGSNELKAILPTDNVQAVSIVTGALALINIGLRLLTSTAIGSILPKL